VSGVHAVADVVAVVLLLAGCFLCLTAGLGLVRFPDVLTRMHAGTKPQVLGVLLIMVGGAIRLHGWSATWMLLLVDELRSEDGRDDARRGDTPADA
jgi:multicomponent Na+:H+ antiporter subunit G